MNERPSLHALELFLAVVDHGTMTAAAEALGMAQPSISVQIKSLEGYFGTPLLERSGRRVHPTAIGLEVAAYTRRLLELVDQLNHVVAEHKSIARGRLSLAASTTATESWLLSVVGQFQRAHPEIELALQVSKSEEVIRAVRAGTAGIGIAGRQDPDDTIVSIPVIEDEILVVAAPDHPLLDRDRIEPAELAAERLIIREAGSATRRLALQCLAALGCRPKRVLEMESNETVKRAVAAGLGIGVLSAHVLSPELGTGALVNLNPAGWDCTRRFWLIHRRDHPLTYPEQAFVRQLEVPGSA